MSPTTSGAPAAAKAAAAADQGTEEPGQPPQQQQQELQLAVVQPCPVCQQPCQPRSAAAAPDVAACTRCGAHVHAACDVRAADAAKVSSDAAPHARACAAGVPQRLVALAAHMPRLWRVIAPAHLLRACMLAGRGWPGSHAAAGRRSARLPVPQLLPRRGRGVSHGHPAAACSAAGGHAPAQAALGGRHSRRRVCAAGACRAAACAGCALQRHRCVAASSAGARAAPASAAVARAHAPWLLRPPVCVRLAAPGSGRAAGCATAAGPCQ